MVSPGQDGPSTEGPRTLGSARLEPKRDVVAGSYGTWTITYTVGKIGMDDGSHLKIAWRVSSDWGLPQFDDPEGDNYATVSTTGAAAVEAAFDPDGYERPWRYTITVDVVDGALTAGDRITVSLGERSAGSMGHRAQTFPEDDVEFRVFVDPLGTNEFVTVPADLTLDVVAGPMHTLEVFGPSVVDPGSEVTVSVRAEDYWGNVATGYSGELVIADTVAGIDVPETVEVTAGTARFPAVIEAEGTHRIQVGDDDRDVVATTNPIRCSAGDEYNLYWGDLHGQSEETVGTGSVQDYFDFARSKAFLDFVSHVGNDFQITDAFWDELRETVSSFNSPGEFVTFLGYEWSANTPNGGDHNIYFKGDEARLHRSSHWQVSDQDDRRSHGLYPVEEVYEQFMGRDDVMIIPHQGGRPATLETVYPELTPFVELVSVWGVFEWFGQAAVSDGHRIGFIGGSDDHSGRPGASYPLGTEQWVFPTTGGLMATRAATLSRESLWAAFNDRRSYATTGARILLETTVDGRGMGSELAVDGSPTMAVRICGTAPIRYVDWFRGDERIAARDLTDGSEKLEFKWQGARSNTRNKLQDWSGGLSIDAGRIVDVEPFGFPYPGHGLTAATDRFVRWDGATAGNHQGVRLDVEAPSDAMVAFNTPPISVDIPVGDLDEPQMFDAGHLDRKLEVRRTGVATSLDVDLEFSDRDGSPGTYPYYVRVTQDDGEMAWSSPIFVTVE